MIRFVYAAHKSGLDQRRLDRVTKALDRCDGWRHVPLKTVDGQKMQLLDILVENDGGESFQIIVTDKGHAQRLASELRGCGLAVVVRCVPLPDDVDLPTEIANRAAASRARAYPERWKL